MHHDLETAAEFFDRVIILNRRLFAYGPPREVMQPELLVEVYGGALRRFSWDADPERGAPRAEAPSP